MTGQSSTYGSSETHGGRVGRIIRIGMAEIVSRMIKSCSRAMLFVVQQHFVAHVDAQKISFIVAAVAAALAAAIFSVAAVAAVSKDLNY